MATRSVGQVAQPRKRSAQVDPKPPSRRRPVTASPDDGEVTDEELRAVAAEARRAMAGMDDITLVSLAESAQERHVVDWWRANMGQLPRRPVDDPMLRPLRSGGPLVRLLHTDVSTEEAVALENASHGGTLRHVPTGDQLRAAKEIAQALERVLRGGSAEEWEHIRTVRDVVVTKSMRRLAVLRVVADAARALHRLKVRGALIASRPSLRDGSEGGHLREAHAVAIAAREHLAAIEPSFAGLEPDFVVEQISLVRQAGKGTGRGHIGAAHAAAALSVECAAFGDGRKTARSIALEDAKRDYRAASSRAFPTKGSRAS